MSTRIRPLLLLAGVLAVTLAAPPVSRAQLQLIAGTDYRVLERPQPPANPGKIEVIEFFSYGCPHCAAFYPLITAWVARLPRDVVFRKVPVSFNRGPWINLARAYYALKSTGDLERLDGKLFTAIHQEHQQLFDGPSLADWVGKNGGSAEKFSAAYQAFSVNNDTVQADQTAQDYAVDGIPSLAVGGKYVALADPNVPQDQYFVQLLAHADALIAITRAASPPAAAPAKTPK
jgi:thiol:disulfide interchange protein DsbA